MINHDVWLRFATAGVLTVLLGMHCVRADAVTIIDYAVPTASSIPNVIVSGPDGNLWFTEASSQKLASITTAGQVREFPLAAGAIAAGPDGNVWFTQDSAIGKITPTGQVTLFAYAGSRPNGITTAADGNLYFTESGGKIGKITPQGNISEYPTPGAGGVPMGIAPGPDGALWYTALGCRTCDTTTPDTIGRITTAGVATEFPIPTSLADPAAIVAGPDGNLWFTEAGCDSCSPRFPGSKVGRITPNGVITEYITPTPQSAPTGIARGSDGNLWFTEHAVNQVARITVNGVITEYPIPVSLPFTTSRPPSIAAGSDGNLWFTESNNNRIGEIILGVAGAAAVAATPALSTIALLALCVCLVVAAFYMRSRRQRAPAS